jgi:SAM-dependent methyltransferase
VIMHPQLSSFLLNGAFAQGPDCTYSAPMPSSVSGQDAERKLREQVDAEHYDNYLASIARHHSIPVMDYDTGRFLVRIPQGGLIIDIGECWGWHWRRLAETRHDLEVLIIDFVRASLVHAQRLLGPVAGTQVALMHADATDLPLPTSTFDGVWTVQNFQHIPIFARACSEARRVLKPGGFFVDYLLHATPFNRMAYWLLGKTFHKEGMHKNKFHHNCANDRQRQIVVDIFIGEVIDRYTECLHHPDLRLTSSGRVGSPIGQLGKLLGELPRLGRRIARQRSFEARKLTVTSDI